MRQGQQNRRGRGRQNNGGHSSSHQTHNQSNNNNNRKGQNPLARSYESNGPDVKIRGNPAHIAEKYTTLARDAHTSGDSVLAEAYLQYAEHYNRIIMAYREQQGGAEGAPRPRSQNDGLDGNSDQGGDEDGGDQSQASDASIRGQEPQPGMFDQPGGRFAERSTEQPIREDRGNRDEQRPQRGYDDRQPRRNDGNRDGGNNRNDGNRSDGNRDGGRRDRYGEAPRGYNGNRDDRRERFDRNRVQIAEMIAAQTGRASAARIVVRTTVRPRTAAIRSARTRIVKVKSDRVKIGKIEIGRVTSGQSRIAPLSSDRWSNRCRSNSCQPRLLKPRWRQLRCVRRQRRVVVQPHRRLIGSSRGHKSSQSSCVDRSVGRAGRRFQQLMRSRRRRWSHRSRVICNGCWRWSCQSQTDRTGSAALS